ncbi:hypothetical protein TNCV_2551441 [Trichonephila clavipes]|nr:hypothetical protein TNCV_2551441 [Trichonephila clavipes]
MQPLGVDVRDFGVKNCYESSGRDWSARSAPIGGEKVCQKRMKDGLHVKNDQITVTVSPVVKVSVELQHPSDLPILEDDLKCLEKPDPMIQCMTEKPDIVSDTEEFQFENCLKDVKEDKACIPLK